MHQTTFSRQNHLTVSVNTYSYRLYKMHHFQHTHDIFMIQIVKLINVKGWQH